jgi:hypothetical protein
VEAGPPVVIEALASCAVINYLAKVKESVPHVRMSRLRGQTMPPYAARARNVGLGVRLVEASIYLQPRATENKSEKQPGGKSHEFVLENWDGKGGSDPPCEVRSCVSPIVECPMQAHEVTWRPGFSAALGCYSCLIR